MNTRSNTKKIAQSAQPTLRRAARYEGHAPDRPHAFLTPDSDGDVVCGGSNHTTDSAATVRVTIPKEVPVTEALRLLKKIVGHIEQGFTPYLLDYVEKVKVEMSKSAPRPINRGRNHKDGQQNVVRKTTS